MSSSGLQELDAFTSFARGRLSSPDLDCTLEECWREWHERAETINDIIEGQREYEAGLCVPAEEVMAELRRKLELMK